MELGEFDISFYGDCTENTFPRKTNKMAFQNFIKLLVCSLALKMEML